VGEGQALLPFNGGSYWALCPSYVFLWGLCTPSRHSSPSRPQEALLLDALAGLSAGDICDSRSLFSYESSHRGTCSEEGREREGWVVSARRDEERVCV
jgi:hypothetical protein